MFISLICFDSCHPICRTFVTETASKDPRKTVFRGEGEGGSSFTADALGSENLAEVILLTVSSRYMCMYVHPIHAITITCHLFHK